MSSSNLSGKSGTVAFQPRARLMKLIGGELVSDEVVAVMELVKNAYDADARTVTIEFNDVLSDEGEIVISDDGHGMSLEDVFTYWMQPGGTSKLGKRNSISRRGRRVLGEKGIGRFAVDKLGTRLVLTTRKKGQKKAVECRFDWSAFDHETRMLSEVVCDWEYTSSHEIHRHGTVLRISGLGAEWSERLFRKMCLRLGRLKTPFHDGDDFQLLIESSEFPDYAGEVTVDYLDRAPHRVDAVFDGDQAIALTGADGKTESLVWNGEGYLECGALRIRLYAFDLEAPSIAKLGPPRAVRGWLREWTGISIYRDGFRLSPYGEPNDDWLRLDQRRVNNPVVCLSNNQVIGFVEIGREQNSGLVDQTNREGMIDNKAFADLRRLVLFVMQQLEAARQKSRHPVGRKVLRGDDVTSAHESVALELDELARVSGSAKPENLKEMARRVRDHAEHEERKVRALAVAYAELAAVGHVAEEVVGRLSGIIDDLEDGVSSLADRSMKKTTVVRKQLSAVRDELALLESVQRVQGGSRRTIDLNRELTRAAAAYLERLEERGILLELPDDELSVVRVQIRPENLHRVIMILFNNSLDWLHRTAQPRIRISIDPEINDRECAVLFSDNGPGIPASIAERAFEPLESGREGARGMGLTIARNIVEGVGGRIEVLQDGRRKGAAIRMLLPRKKNSPVRSKL